MIICIKYQSMADSFMGNHLPVLKLSSGVEVAWFCLFIFSKYSCFSCDNSSPRLKYFFLSSYKMHVNRLNFDAHFSDE